MSERKIIRIPPKIFPNRIKRVAIYCRVSTHHAEQEESLRAQIGRYEKMVRENIDWILVKTYSDIASGRNTTGRTEFTNLINDCMAGEIDLIITKSISRFGRNTVDILSNVRELRKYGVDVYFENENMNSSDSASELMLSIISAVAQEDSASKSQNIRIGIEYQLTNGTSYLYSRPCYGYKKNDKGNLVIDEKQAKNVELIFNLYLKGHSVVSIIHELKRRKIKSPTNKATWSKRSIEIMLVNEKYIGDVLVGKTFKNEFPSNKRTVNKGVRKMYELKKSHKPIIKREIFEKVQGELLNRSNIILDGNGRPMRKDRRYSMKGIGTKKIF